MLSGFEPNEGVQTMKYVLHIFATILLGIACATLYTMYFNITLGLATIFIFSTFLMKYSRIDRIYFHPLLNTSAQLVCAGICIDIQRERYPTPPPHTHYFIYIFHVIKCIYTILYIYTLLLLASLFSVLANSF